jgi:hypothetical protein
VTLIRFLNSAYFFQGRHSYCCRQDGPYADKTAARAAAQRALAGEAIMTDDPSSKETAGIPGEGASPESPHKEEPLGSAAVAAKTANKAVTETAGISPQPESKSIWSSFRTGFATGHFFMWLAAGMGFVAGGGIASKWGLALLGLAGRRAAAETATNFGRQMVRQTAKRGAASA